MIQPLDQVPESSDLPSPQPVDLGLGAEEQVFHLPSERTDQKPALRPRIVSHRDRVMALFEKHRSTPAAPYDETHFLDFLLPEQEKENAIHRFRRLQRFNPFIDEVQYEFGICFAQKDRETNYSLNKFVERAKELERSPRSSLASLKNQIDAGSGWVVIVVADLILLGAALGFSSHVWVVAPLVAVAAVLNAWFFRFTARAKAYQAKLLAKIEGKKGMS